jgi:polyribonucleotide nucleotidyltransferase
VGHGALAEKAILPALPPPSQFPYAIRITSEVTGSNGSSSMASVCGATLALLDAGVPIKAPVAGLSVGLVKSETNGVRTYQLLVDITGTEDHYGLMDAKIAGTYDKVTAIHMDVHEPLPHFVVFDALRLAKVSRGVLLDEMKSQATQSSDWDMVDFSPRAELKPSAPRVEVVRFDPQRKKDLLGPGGIVIRQMEDRFNVSLDLTQEGQCLLFGDDQEMVRKARAAVMDLVSDVEVGGIYEGTIIEVHDFGIIVELLRNKEGLCHVSEMASKKDIRKHPRGSMGLVSSMVQIGQKIEVECIGVDQVMGTIRLRPSNRKDFSLGE